MDVEEQKTSQEIDLIELASTVWSYKWMALAIMTSTAIAGILYILLVPKTYQTETTVYPISSSGKSSQLSDIASLAGFGLLEGSTTSEPGKVVRALLSSRLLAEALVSETNLEELIDKAPSQQSSESTKAADTRQAVSKIQKATSYKIDSTTGVIQIQVSWTDPLIAMTLCNKLVKVLDDLLVTKSLTATRKKNESLQRQIQLQRKKLESYQDQLVQFQRQTSLLNPAAQSNRSVDTYTNMIQQKMNLELQLANAEASYSQDNPKLIQLKNQLINLEAQISQVKNQINGDLPSLKTAPDVLIRYQNLTRDLEITSKLYSGLLASQEQARLADDTEQVYIEVLDEAQLPRNPKENNLLTLGLFLVLGTVLSVIVGTVIETVKYTIWQMSNRRNE